MNHYIEFNNNENNNAVNFTQKNTYSLNNSGTERNKINSGQYNVYTKVTSQNKQTSKKAQDLSKIATIFLTVISALTVCIFGFEGILPPNIQAQILYLEASETSIFYVVSVEDYDDLNEIYVVLQNDFTDRSSKMEEPQFEGIFEDLQENMTYTLKIVLGRFVLASKNVTTSLIRKADDYSTNGY